MKLSIIIVNYNVTDEVLTCLRSIKTSDYKSSFEVIIIDNSAASIKELQRKEFSNVRYFKNPKNTGFGVANNLGVSVAKGEYLFFLNPDTIVNHDAVTRLVDFLERHSTVAAVSPLLQTMDGKPYLQGNTTLGVKEGIVSLSFLNKLFPNNPISRKYFLTDMDMKTNVEVDVLPGTAIMIRKDIFEGIGGFDERFFLFFEEFDLCKRLREKGHKLMILSKANVKHAWGVSTGKFPDISKQAFENSKFYYFQKHFGIIPALFVSAMTQIGRYHFFLLLVLFFAFVLRIYELKTYMPFIGDHGWFYLSARDFLQTGEIPLVGIPSSRPWLHQGAFWSYLLAPFLLIFNYNPVAGAYLAVSFGLGTAVLIYLLGSAMFSKQTGLIATFLYAASPVLIMSDRTPYHTTPIPFFTALLLLVVYRWLKGSVSLFPLIPFLFVILYNFEIATVTLAIPFLTIFLRGLLKKKAFVLETINRKYVVLSLIAAFVPLIPMMLYDLTHGFAQTGRFLLWIPYRIISLLGYRSEHAISSDRIAEMITFVVDSFGRLIYLSDKTVALVIGLLAGTWLLFIKRNTKQFADSSVTFLTLFFVLPLLGIIVNQTPSDAYLFILFPSLFVLVAAVLSRLTHKINKWLMVVVIGLLGIVNCVFLVQNNYLMGGGKTYGYTLEQRMSAAKVVISLADEKSYTLKGEGSGSQFESFTMNYQYLLWYLKHPVTEKNAELSFTILETSNGIIVRQEK